MSDSAHTGHADEHFHGVNFPPDEFYGRASPGKIGMWIFLLTDALMFAGFLLGYGILRGGSDVWINPGEPELGINFTAGLTFLLICSSVTMVLAFAAAVEKDQKSCVRYLILTAIGGALFLCGQYHEYWGIWHPGLSKHGLGFGESNYATTFYVITSFHGMHVLTGVILLSITAFRTSRRKEMNADVVNEIEIVGLFWHFVDLIWILVFTLVYLVPSREPVSRFVFQPGG